MRSKFIQLLKIYIKIYSYLKIKKKYADFLDDDKKILVDKKKTFYVMHLHYLLYTLFFKIICVEFYMLD